MMSKWQLTKRDRENYLKYSDNCFSKAPILLFDFLRVINHQINILKMNCWPDFQEISEKFIDCRRQVSNESAVLIAKQFVKRKLKCRAIKILEYLNNFVKFFLLGGKFKMKFSLHRENVQTIIQFRQKEWSSSELSIFKF